MRGYFGLEQLSTTEKQDILSQHKNVYNGYQTMHPQVSNTQPLYVFDPAGDKNGIVVNNKGEVKKYTNIGINEQVKSKEMCEQCGGTMREDICEQCGSKMEGEVEEGDGKLDDIYNQEDLNPDAGFDYIQGSSNSVDTFEKMNKKLYNEDEYEDPDNEDDGFEDIQAGEEMGEDITDGKPYEMGKRGMRSSHSRSSFIPSPLESEIINTLFGQYGEDIPPIAIRYLRKLPRKVLTTRLLKLGLIDKETLENQTNISEQGGGSPDMDVSDMDSAYDFVSQGPGEVYPNEEEISEEDMLGGNRLKYKRRGVTYSNLSTFIDYEKTQFDMCGDFNDEFEYADSIITSALDTFFSETGQDIESDFFDELHDLCKEWFGDDLISSYISECNSFEEDDDFMESAFQEEMDEVDVSGSQGIYGDMDSAYDFDSKGPGNAGPYQRFSYNEEDDFDGDDSEEEWEEIDINLQEGFKHQKNKINEMMSRMKKFK
jgi:hypothetical protein